jgi:prevent-host-death family protein
MVIFASVGRMPRGEAVNIAAAKARLPELVERASTGERFVLTRNGKPKALLIPIPGKKKYVFGAGRGQWRGMERLLRTPLPDAVAEAFYRGPLAPTRDGK